MKLYRFQWFSSVDWAWFEGYVIARDQAEAEAFLDENEYVNDVPYSDGEKSLKLVEVIELRTPSYVSEPKKWIGFD